MKKKYINPEMLVTCVAVKGMINLSATIDTYAGNAITNPDDFGVKHRDDFDDYSGEGDSWGDLW